MGQPSLAFLGLSFLYYSCSLRDFNCLLGHHYHHTEDGSHVSPPDVLSELYDWVLIAYQTLPEISHRYFKQKLPPNGTHHLLPKTLSAIFLAVLNGTSDLTPFRYANPNSKNSLDTSCFLLRPTSVSF